MGSPRKDASSPGRTVDADGVVRIDHPRSRARILAGAGLVVVVAAVAWLFVSVRGERGSKRPSVGPTAGAAAAPGRVPIRFAAPSGGAATDGASDTDHEGAAEREVYLNQIDRTGLPREGIHAFNQPGTKPIKGGILVPDGYQLPPGYMRHYQTTDDGEPVAPILVFHPDYHPVDASGQPIPLPEDRVVPPELAPPGMPLQALEPPPVRRDFEQTSAPR
ncbi:MAG TPA: hypothetical protein VK698_04405 [Kofleriaceae bacterium]|nr:hypothetical protein [Kofleriaceae bacterium]